MRRRTRGWAATAAAAVVAAFCALAAPGAAATGDAPRMPAAVAPAAVIESRGPLTLIEISPDLTCLVQHIEDDLPEFFEYTACATLVAYDGELWGPESIPGGDRALPRELWKTVSQTEFGSGTPGDPFTITTVVAMGRLLLSQTDTYVVGEESYRTDIAVRSISEVPIDAIVYHAGDCQLQNSDEGLGSYTPATEAISCHPPTESGQIEPGGRVEEFVPLTPGSDYLYATDAEVWFAIGIQEPLPDEVRGEGRIIDHAIGLSWAISADTENDTILSFRTNFAPVEVQALPTSLALSTDSPLVGDEVVVTATIENPNGFAQTVDAVDVALPDGVEYVGGSTFGIGEPAFDGSTLSFGAVSIAGGEALEFGFTVIPTIAGDETLQLAGFTDSGTPVLSSNGFLAVREAEAPPGDEDEGGTTPPPPPGIDPGPFLWGGGGALLLIVAGAASVAVLRSPRRVQNRLVRRHIRLAPRQASTIGHAWNPDVPAPEPPTFGLVGRDGTWQHHVTEETP